MDNYKQGPLVNGVTMAEAEQFLSMGKSGAKKPGSPGRPQGSAGRGGWSSNMPPPLRHPVAFHQALPPLVYPSRAASQQPQQRQDPDYRNYSQQQHVAAPPRQFHPYSEPPTVNQSTHINEPTAALDLANLSPTRMAENMFGINSQESKEKEEPRDENEEKKIIDDDDSPGWLEVANMWRRMPPPPAIPIVAVYTPQHLIGQALPFDNYYHQLGQSQPIELSAAEEFSVRQKFAKDVKEATAKFQQIYAENNGCIFFDAIRPNEQVPTDDISSPMNAANEGRGRPLNSSPPAGPFQTPNENKSMNPMMDNVKENGDGKTRKRKVEEQQQQPETDTGKRARDQLIEEDGQVYTAL